MQIFSIVFFFISWSICLSTYLSFHQSNWKKRNIYIFLNWESRVKNPKHELFTSSRFLYSPLLFPAFACAFILLAQAWGIGLLSGRKASPLVPLLPPPTALTSGRNLDGRNPQEFPLFVPFFPFSVLLLHPTCFFLSVSFLVYILLSDVFISICIYLTISLYSISSVLHSLCAYFSMFPISSHPSFLTQR